jgi:hypothetical protein
MFGYPVGWERYINQRGDKLITYYEELFVDSDKRSKQGLFPNTYQLTTNTYLISTTVPLPVFSSSPSS